jgi:hypothetical protein
VEASNKGTEQALDKANIEKAMIDASLDSQTCEPGTFNVTIEGETYTSCREWDGLIVDRRNLPQIPSESHPNDRCAILAHVGD